MNRVLELSSRAIALIAVTIVAPAVVSSPAHASVGVFHDPTGDVRSHVDVTRVSVQNAPRRLVLTTRYVNLSRSVEQFVGYGIDVGGPHPGPDFSVGAGFDGADGEWNVFRARHWHAYGAPLACKSNLVTRFARDFTRFTVSRGCLGGSRSTVRISMDAGENRADGSVVNDYLPAYRELTNWIPIG